MLAIQPIRHGIFKKYFDKYKYNKVRRELLIKTIEESEESVVDVLGPSGEYVHFLDAIPEMRTFLAEIEAKEKLEAEQEAAVKALETVEPVTEQKPKKKKGKKAKAAEEDEDGEKKPELKEGDKQGELIEEIFYDPEKFNPFDRTSAK